MCALILNTNCLNAVKTDERRKLRYESNRFV